MEKDNKRENVCNKITKETNKCCLKKEKPERRFWVSIRLNEGRNVQ